MVDLSSSILSEDFLPTLPFPPINRLNKLSPYYVLEESISVLDMSGYVI